MMENASMENKTNMVVLGVLSVIKLWGVEVLPMLFDHKVTGIGSVYIHEKALFDMLLASLERITATILFLRDVKGG